MNPQPIYEAAAWDHGFAPVARELGAVRVLRHEPICHRCTLNGTPGFYCPPCEAEVAANRADARDELVATLYTGHGLGHGDYRADVRGIA